MMGLRIFWSSAALTGFMASFAAANWDPATGHLSNYMVTPEWLAKNKPMNITRDIQVSECAKNTRLHFPNVQLFALFKVDHEQDHYHGCPYGDCLAFTVAPTPQEVVPSFTDSHLFFWHDYGGVPGDGVKPISDPQTGAYGYEQSLTGKFKSGPIDMTSIQLHHDSNYPNFIEAKLKRWSPEERHQFKAYQISQPSQPKCGRPCDPNKDPGSAPGAYGNYKPNPTKDYTPPPSWVAGAEDKCWANGNHQSITQPGPDADGNGNGTHQNPGGNATHQGSGGNGNETHHNSGGNGNGPNHKAVNRCKGFCRCLKKCNDDDCSTCHTKNNKGCSQDSCNISPIRSKKSI